MHPDRHPNPFQPESDPSDPARPARAAFGAALGAALLALLLTGCGGAPAPREADAAPAVAPETEVRPDAVARVADSRAGARLLEGARRVGGALYPDGRVYLERDGGRTLLLTAPADFGEAFFADALALLPDADGAGGLAALVRVSGERSGLYRVAPGAAPRALFGLDALGGGEPVPGSVVVADDGGTVAFVTYGPVAAPWAGPPGAREGYTLEPAVWRFDPRAAAPAATLERVADGAELERRGYRPDGPLPSVRIGARGRVEIAIRAP